MAKLNNFPKVVSRYMTIIINCRETKGDAFSNIPTLPKHYRMYPSHLNTVPLVYHTITFHYV